MADGDTITVYIDTADPRESGNVPREIQKAAAERTRARAARDYQKADGLQKMIADAGYRSSACTSHRSISFLLNFQRWFMVQAV